MADYDIDIEIDAESGDILWRKGDKEYTYHVEEIENARQVLDALEGNAEITVYSQGRTLTYTEYKQIVGEL